MSVAGVARSTVAENCLMVPGNFAGQNDRLSSESILIYLTVVGSVIPMRIMESDSIASVKLKIQTFKGFFVKKQKLVFGGRELARSNTLIRDYGVADGNVVHLMLRLSDLQAIIIRTVCGKEFEFQVERSRNVGYLKQQIVNKGSGFFDLKDKELVCDGEELEDQRLINDLCKDGDAVVHLLVRKTAKVRAKPVKKHFEIFIDASDLKETDVIDEHQLIDQLVGVKIIEKKPLHNNFLLEPLVDSGMKLHGVLEELISSTFQGLERGNQPIRSFEGSGGAYFMPNPSGLGYASVFKPIDEEPLAVNNPRGLPVSIYGQGLKKGTRVGEGALREVAAYLLDHPIGGPRSFYDTDIGFAGVPPTILVKCLHAGFNHPKGYDHSSKNIKIGSLQMYVKNHGSCEELGPSVFPVEEVHKISVLDMRLANADRHAGNILVIKDGEDGKIFLVPIDHGYCLPENFEDCTFEWLYWPQSKKPFSSKTINYIRSLDAEQDIELLRFHGWDMPNECARTIRISTMLLKKGVDRGLTPYTIGSMMCRETLNEESVIEQIVREAEETILPGTREVAFLESVSLIMDRYLDELST